MHVPCFAHSLNLVGISAAESCQEAVRFFDFVESVYVFYSASTLRWKILVSEITKTKKTFVAKKMSETRWSTRCEAVHALLFSLYAIKSALLLLSEDQNQKAECRLKAHSLHESMLKLETCFLIIFGEKIL